MPSVSFLLLFPAKASNAFLLPSILGQAVKVTAGVWTESGHFRKGGGKLQPHVKAQEETGSPQPWGGGGHLKGLFSDPSFAFLEPPEPLPR